MYPRYSHWTGAKVWIVNVDQVAGDTRYHNDVVSVLSPITKLPGRNSYKWWQATCQELLQMLQVALGNHHSHAKICQVPQVGKGRTMGANVQQAQQPDIADWDLQIVQHHCSTSCKAISLLLLASV